MKTLHNTDQATIGAVLLDLAAKGETESLTWEDLDQAIRFRIDERKWYIECLINDALDKVLEGTQI